jgi:hypothetical protein
MLVRDEQRVVACPTAHIFCESPNASAQRRAERSEARPLERVVGLALSSVEPTPDTAGTSVRLASK